MLALIGSFLIFIPLSIVGIVLIGCMKISTIMKYLNWIWYGPYFIVSLAWGMACIFVEHHIEHWRYARSHRSHAVRVRLWHSRFFWWL